MKPFLLLIVGVFALVSCKAGCDVEKVVAEGLGTAVAKLGKCTGVANVDARILQVIDFAKLCDNTKDCEKGQKQGVIANIVCPIVSKAAVSVIGNQVPENWACDLQGSSVPVILEMACKTLPL